MKKNTGFTLMELMIVIAIIMILSGAIVARIGTGSEKAKIAKAKAEMEEIASACRAFYMDTGYWPCMRMGHTPRDGDPGMGMISKDAILYVRDDNGDTINAPSVIDGVKANWKGPYLDVAYWPQDPWSAKTWDDTWRLYRLYYFEGYGPKRKLTVVSLGPDRVLNNAVYIYTYGKGDPTTDDLALLVHVFNK